MVSRLDKRVFVFGLVVYLLAALLTGYLLEIKQASLQFHPRDYSYFIEQAAKLADPRLKDRYALNVEGLNFFGMTGSEGATDLFQALHTEYFRYFYVLLYWLFHSTGPIYAFYGLVFFLPVIYAAAIPRAPDRQAWVGPVLLILLYVLYPATFLSAASDLRPRLLFAPAWVAVVLAVYYDRPFWEKLALFLLLITIREEGILLGMIVAALNLLWMLGKPLQRKNGAAKVCLDPWLQSGVMLGLDLLALGIFFGFMRWNGYTTFDQNSYFQKALAFLVSKRGIASLLGAGAALAGLLAFLWLRRPAWFFPVLLLLAYFSAVLLTGLQVYEESKSWAVVMNPVFRASDLVDDLATSHAGLVFYILLLLLVLLLDFARGKRRVLLQAFLGGLCGLFALMTLLVLPGSIARWQNGIAQAQVVWDFKRSVDPYSTNVLVDYDAYQAFFDFDQIVVYERLPLRLAHPEQRFYPENTPLLVQLVKEKMDYAVTGRASAEIIRGLAAKAGVKVEEVGSSGVFVVMKFIK